MSPYQHLLMDDGPVLLEDAIRLLLVEDEPLDGPTDLAVLDVRQLPGHGEHLDHVGGQPGEGHT